MTVLACDVADEYDAQHALGRQPPRQTMPTAAGGSLGIVHAAGVLRDALLRKMSRGGIRDVYAPKASGAYRLHSATMQSPSRDFVMYSSDASCLGNLGQANYAAANAYLDALACERHLSGRAACSLQLPLVRGAGMGAAALVSGKVASDVAGLTMHEYTRCLVALVSSAAIFSTARAPVLIPFDRTSLCTRLPPSARSEIRYDEVAPVPRLASPSLAGTTSPAVAGSAHVNAPLQGSVALCSTRGVSGADVLKLVQGYAGSADDATPSTTLLDLDLDSLAIGALAGELSAAFGVSVEAAELITAADCAEIAAMIGGRGGTVQGLSGSLLPVSAAVTNQPPLRGSVALCSTRGVSGADVLKLVQGYAGSADDATPSTTLLDLDLDSLAIGALAGELSAAFGVSVEAAELITAADCAEIAAMIGGRGGAVQEALGASVALGASDLTGQTTVNGIVCSQPCKGPISAEQLAMSHPISGEDVFKTLRACIPTSELETAVTAATPLLELDIDSLAMAALTEELASTFQVPLSVATLIAAHDCHDVADAVNVARRRSNVLHSAVESRASSETIASSSSSSSSSGDGGHAGGVDDSSVPPSMLGTPVASRRRPTQINSVQAMASKGSDALKTLENENEVLKRCADRDAFEAALPPFWKLFCVLVRMVAATINMIIGIGLPGAFVMTCVLEVSQYEGVRLTAAFAHTMSSSPGESEHDVFVYYVVAGFVALCAALWASMLVSVLWSAVLMRLMAPTITPGMQYQHWGWLWLWRQCTVADPLPKLLVLPEMFTKETQVYVWIMRLLGVRVGENAIIGCPLPSVLRQPNLVAIGDNCLLEDRAELHPIVTTDGMTYTAHAIFIGNDVTILDRATLYGCRMGDGATASISSFVQGDVPARAVVRSSDVLDASQRDIDPAVAAVCMETTMCCRGCGASKLYFRLLACHLIGMLFVVGQLCLSISFAFNMGAFCVLRYYRIGEPVVPRFPLFGTVVAFICIFVLTVQTAIFSSAFITKWFVIGYRRPGPVALTPTRLVSEWYYGILCNQMRLAMHPYLWTCIDQLHQFAFGGWDLARSATYSPFISNVDYELLHFKDCAYMGAGAVFKTFHVLHDKLGRGSTAIFAPITCRPYAFVGPATNVLPGTILEECAGVMECSVAMPMFPRNGSASYGSLCSPAKPHWSGSRVGFSGAPIRSNTIMVGCAGKVMRFKPDHMKHPTQSSTFYNIYIVALLLPRWALTIAGQYLLPALSAFHFSQLASTVMPRVAVEYGLVHAPSTVFGQHFLEAAYATCGGLFGGFFLTALVYDPLCAAVNAVIVRVVMIFVVTRRNASRVAYPLKSFGHSVWVSCIAQVNIALMRFNHVAPSDLFLGTALPRVLHRLGGSQVGRHVTFQTAYPNQAELALIKYEDCAYLDGISKMGVYSHNL